MNLALIVSFGLALVPVLIWAGIMFKGYRNKKVAVLMFFGGILAVFFMALIQVLGDYVATYSLRDILHGVDVGDSLFGVLNSVWVFIQKYNPVALMRDKTHGLLVVFTVAGALEEIFKQWLVRRVDDNNLLIQDINTSVQYSFMAALGFAFAENVYYFYNVWTQLGAGSLIGVVIFRSTFTTAAHMCFSGIWGYYYGLGKFCVNIVEQKKWAQRKMLGAKFISWLRGVSLTEGFREQMIFKGLFIAMGFHAVFNFLLEKEDVLPVMLAVISAFGLLIFLLQRKSGKLILVNDIDSKQISTMANSDENTVIEYIGILYNQGQYDQVIETCQRLLERDPDNTVVKLFQAKAEDKKKLKSYIGNLVAKKEKVEGKQGVMKSGLEGESGAVK